MVSIIVFIIFAVVAYNIFKSISTNQRINQSSNSGNAVYTDHSDSNVTNNTTNSTSYINTSISASDYNRYDSNVNSIDMDECDDAIKSYSSNFLDNVFNVHKNDLSGREIDFTEGIEDYVDRKKMDYQVTSKNNDSYWESKKLSKKDQWEDNTRLKKDRWNGTKKDNTSSILSIIIIVCIFGWPIIATLLAVVFELIEKMLY